MAKIRLFALMTIFFAAAGSCHRTQPKPGLSCTDVNKVINQMTGLMVHDVTNPPLAARIFAYSCLAGYEIVSENDHQIKGMFGKLKQYPRIEKPGYLSGYDYKLSALFAMLETASQLEPFGKQLLAYEDVFADSCKRIGFDGAVVDSSQHYAQFISKKYLHTLKQTSTTGQVISQDINLPVCLARGLQRLLPFWPRLSPF